MSTFNCRGCLFWKPNYEPNAERQAPYGECRRHAPRIKFDRFDNDARSSVWPPTDAGDWCGEHRPKTLPLPFDASQDRSLMP